jgi:hypothetical protein
VLILILKPEKKLAQMDKLIDENPEIHDIAHRDLAGCVKKSGREGLSGESTSICRVKAV